MSDQRRRRIFFALFMTVVLWAPGLGAQSPRGAGVPPEALPVKLRDLAVKDHFLPAPFDRVGVVHALTGHLVVLHRATREAYFARKGDPLFENDSLTTLSDSRCRLKFSDGDVVTMAAETEFGIERFQDRREERRKSSTFSMLKGKAMFYAMRLFRYREMRFKLKTPTAVVGVRGTKFGAQVYQADAPRVGRIGTKVADSGQRPVPFLAAAGPPGDGAGFTDCFCEDGFVDINGRVVAPGEMFRGDTGAVAPTPPDFLRAFEAATEIGFEGETGPGAGAGKSVREILEEVAALLQSSGVPGLGEYADMVAGAIEHTQRQTIIEAGVILMDLLEAAKTMQEVSAIATIIVNAGGQAYLLPLSKGPMYFSLQDNSLTAGPATHLAYEAAHQNDNAYKLVLRENDDGGSSARVDFFSWGATGDIALHPPHDFKYFQGGAYADRSGRVYLEWGWWEDVATVDRGLIGDDGVARFFAGSAKIWHMEAQRTHPDDILDLHHQGAVYNYSGEAKGLYAESGGPGPAHNLSGPFSCRIDFGLRTVEDLDINVSGGGIQVHLQGSGALDLDGGFEVPGLTGTIGPAPVNPLASIAAGGCAGERADGVGGLWHAHDGLQRWAVGEFHGRR